MTKNVVSQPIMDLNRNTIYSITQRFVEIVGFLNFGQIAHEAELFQRWAKASVNALIESGSR